MRYTMFTIIVGSAVGFLCAVSLITAIAFLVVYKQRQKQAKKLEESSKNLLHLLNKGDD